MPHVPQAEEVVIGLDHPDDAAVLRLPSDRLLVQTTDYFRAIVNDPYLFGKIAANHCLSDIFAMGGMPQSVLAIAVVPEAVAAKQEETLYQLLLGAAQVLAEAKAPLIGGHTSEGTDLAFGLTCNGLVRQEQILAKGGLQPGQRLILTKALGTGTLFAADMRRQAKGRWIEAAIASMVQSNQDAALCLQQHQVKACTDVTGFGLLGHLVEMIKASDGVAVELWWDELPILAGARDMVQQGIVSSLYPQNLRAAYYLYQGEQISDQADFPLLFDPQTAGGLLAAVPTEQADLCLAALHDLGYTESRLVGQVMSRDDETRPIRMKKTR
jgi:selenide,water dikinase